MTVQTRIIKRKRKKPHSKLLTDRYYRVEMLGRETLVWGLVHNFNSKKAAQECARQLREYYGLSGQLRRKS